MRGQGARFARRRTPLLTPQLAQRQWSDGFKASEMRPEAVPSLALGLLCASCCRLGRVRGCSKADIQDIEKYTRCTRTGNWTEHTTRLAQFNLGLPKQSCRVEILLKLPSILRVSVPKRPENFTHTQNFSKIKET